MTRQEQVAFCKICQHQKKDFDQGIICGLTSKKADFKMSCDTFIEDRELVIKQSEESNLCLVDAKTASQGQRLANYMIDQIFVIGLGLAFGVFLGIVLGLYKPEYISYFEVDNRLRDWLLGSILAIIYYSFFEGVTGRSLGKFFTKTKVVTEDGERPGFATIFTRSLCRCIPFNAFSFLSNNGVGWHDKFSGTRVIEID